MVCECTLFASLLVIWSVAFHGHYSILIFRLFLHLLLCIFYSVCMILDFSTTTLMCNSALDFSELK